MNRSVRCSYVLFLMFGIIALWSCGTAKNFPSKTRNQDLRSPQTDSADATGSEGSTSGQSEDAPSASNDSSREESSKPGSANKSKDPNSNSSGREKNTEDNSDEEKDSEKDKREDNGSSGDDPGEDQGNEEDGAPEDDEEELDPAANGDPNVVVFRIQEGTGAGPWNSEDNPIQVEMGNVLRIVNEDTVTHRLHTNGAPCPHGDPIPPGEMEDCEIERAVDVSDGGTNLYDHIYQNEDPIPAVFIQSQ